MPEFTTKDSGARAVFDSGMQRDTEAGKPRFDLTLAANVPYEDQMLTRLAALMGRGAEKYDDRNWEKAEPGGPELERMKSSAFRHFMQWICGETDEDHAAAVMFNIVAYESTVAKRPEGGSAEGRAAFVHEWSTAYDAVHDIKYPSMSQLVDQINERVFVDRKTFEARAAGLMRPECKRLADEHGPDLLSKRPPRPEVDTVGGDL